MHIKASWTFEWIVALGLCLGSSAAFAQQDDQIRFAEKHASLECMLVPGAQGDGPIYPSAAREGQYGAMVDVKLTFSAPDAAPKVEVLGKQNPEFDDAVRQHVKRYRLPCFVSGQAPVEARQQFQFQYDDGRPFIHSGLDGSARSAYESCVVSAQPVYPAVVGQSGEGGTIILSMSFSRRSAPPEVKVIYGGRNRWLREAAVEAAQKYRFNCDIPDGAPLVATQQFLFRVEDGEAFKLHDMGLLQFLRSVDRSGFGKVRFDLRAMGCPFDLNVALFRPYLPNRIVEFAQSDSSRREFLEWLSQLTMQFPKGSEQYLIGKSLKLSVPCTVLDLS